MTTTTQTDTIRDLQRQIDFLTMQLEAQAAPTGPRLDNRTLLANGRTCHLSKLEAKLMSLLLDSPGEVIHYARVKRWSNGEYALRLLVHRLKNKLCKSKMFNLADSICPSDNGYLLQKNEMLSGGASS